MLLFAIGLFCLPFALALPLDAPPKPGPGAVLVQYVGPPGGAATTPPPESTPLVTTAIDYDNLPECEQDDNDGHIGEPDHDYINPNNHINNNADCPPVKAKGLVAAETTVTVPPAKGSSAPRLVVYYQEKHSRVAFTSRGPNEPTRRPFAMAAPTTRSVDDSPRMDEDAMKWLGLHNEARAQYGAGQLVWSDELKERARRNAELCTGDHS